MKLLQTITQLQKIYKELGNVDLVIRNNYNGDIYYDQEITFYKLTQEDHEESCVIVTNK